MNDITRVYFVYQTTDQPYGGANTFNLLLKDQFQKNPNLGIQVVSHPNDADVLFLNAGSLGPKGELFFSIRKLKFVYGLRDRTIHPWQLKNLKQGRPLNSILGLFNKSGTGRPVVQRLDGVTAKYGRNDGHVYDRIQSKLNRETTLTVFQSKFCEESFRPYLDPFPVFEIIPNGAEGDVFRFEQKKQLGNPVKILAAAFSSNPKKGHEAIATLSEIPDTDVQFMGHWPNKISKKHVKILPVGDRRQLAQVMRESDIFAHLAENDPAPNVVSEALAVGRPVLYLNSGGLPEILEQTKFGQPIYNTQKPVISTGLDQIKSRYFEILSNIQQNRIQFLIETSASRFAKAFQKAKNSMEPINK